MSITVIECKECTSLLEQLKLIIPSGSHTIDFLPENDCVIVTTCNKFNNNTYTLSKAGIKFKHSGVDI